MKRLRMPDSLLTRGGTFFLKKIKTHVFSIVFLYPSIVFLYVSTVFLYFLHVSYIVLYVSLCFSIFFYFPIYFIFSYMLIYLEERKKGGRKEDGRAPTRTGLGVPRPLECPGAPGSAQERPGVPRTT